MIRMNPIFMSSRAAPVAVALACCAFAFAAGPAPAPAAKVVKIGGGKEFGPPSCPTPAKAQKRAENEGIPVPNYLACNAFGHVTGFQIRTDTEKAVHKVPRDGKLVAWNIDLSKPRSNPKNDALVDERSFFADKLSDETFDRYGARPVANIEVLKKQGRGRFKLVKKSPIVELDPWLGQNPLFTLGKPLKVKKGSIVALSTPTWSTNFALAKPGGKASLSDQNLWRASRKDDRCEVTRREDGSVDDSNLTKLSKPHVRKGSTKKYGCVYSGAQILYKAFMVPDSKGGKKGGGKNKGGGKGKRRRVSTSASTSGGVTVARGGGLSVP